MIDMGRTQNRKGLLAMKRNWFRKALILTMVVMTLLSTTVSALAVGQSSTLAKKGDRYIVYCNKLNFRNGASMSSRILRTLRKGTYVTFIKNVRGWWYVRLSNGSKGYVDKQFLTPRHVPRPAYYTTLSKVSMRNKPRSSGTRIRIIPKDTRVKVTAVNGDWGKAVYGGDTGWIALKYVK